MATTLPLFYGKVRLIKQKTIRKDVKCEIVFLYYMQENGIIIKEDVIVHGMVDRGINGKRNSNEFCYGSVVL